VELIDYHRRAVIEIDEPPTYLDWVVTAALQHLGGNPSRWPWYVLVGSVLRRIG
jgi:hypothetical protein